MPYEKGETPRPASRGGAGEVGRRGLSDDDRPLVLDEMCTLALRADPERYEDNPEALQAAAAHVLERIEAGFLGDGGGTVSLDDLAQAATSGMALLWLRDEFDRRARRGRRRLSIAAEPRQDDPADLADLRRFLEQFASRCRQEVFGSPQPPFEDEDEAEKWLRRELGWREAEDGLISLKSRKPGAAAFSPWEAQPSPSGPLAKLCEARDLLAGRAFGSTREDAFRYLLLGTGRLGLWRVEVEEPLFLVREGGQPRGRGCLVHVLWFSRQFRERDLRRLADELRRRGVSPSRPRVADDEALEDELFEFVRERRRDDEWRGLTERPLSWSQIRREWNGRHGPRQRYGSDRGLRTRYFAIREKRGLPRPPRRRGRDGGGQA